MFGKPGVLTSTLVASKRNHYVPIAYQKAWGSEGRGRRPLIGVFDKSAGLYRSQPIHDTAVEGHRYSLPEHSGQPRDALELEIQRTEDLALPILRDLDADVPDELAPEHVEVLAWHAAVMQARVPQASDHVRVLGEAFMTNLLDADVTSPSTELTRLHEEMFPGRTPDWTGMRASLQSGDIRVAMLENVAALFSLRTAEVVFREFRRLNWRLVQADGGEEFITSDAPVCVCAVSGNKLIFGGGLQLPGVEVSFPLSPALCLVGDRAPRRYTTVVRRPRREDLDWRQAMGAKRFVLYRSRTGDVEDTIGKMLRHPQPARDQGEIDDLARRHARKLRP